MIPRLTPGQKWRPSASAWNTMAEAAEHTLTARARGGTAGGMLYPWHGQIRVRVKNELGNRSRFQRGTLVALGEPMLQPSSDPDTFWTDQNLLAARDYLSSPADNEEKCAVLDDVSDGSNVGWAIYHGLVWAEVDIRSTNHRYCTPRVTSNHLQFQSDFWGRGTILWKPGGTGLMMCLIHLGTFRSDVYIATARQSIYGPNSFGTVQIGTYEFTADCPFAGHIENNSYVAVTRRPGEISFICGYWRDPTN